MINRFMKFIKRLSKILHKLSGDASAFRSDANEQHLIYEFPNNLDFNQDESIRKLLSIYQSKYVNQVENYQLTIDVQILDQKKKESYKYIKLKLFKNSILCSENIPNIVNPVNGWSDRVNLSKREIDISGLSLDARSDLIFSLICAFNMNGNEKFNFSFGGYINQI